METQVSSHTFKMIPRPLPFCITHLVVGGGVKRSKSEVDVFQW